MAKVKRKATGTGTSEIYTSSSRSMPVTSSEYNKITFWLGFSTRASFHIVTDFDVVQLGQKGLTKKSVNALADNIGISRKSMAEDIFDVSVKTMERKSENAKLDKRISSHAVEIAKIVQHAFVIFGDNEKVKLWIGRENKALNNMKPVQFFDTLTGLNMVNDILTRIEEGVYT